MSNFSIKKEAKKKNKKQCKTRDWLCTTIAVINELLITFIKIDKISSFASRHEMKLMKLFQFQLLTFTIVLQCIQRFVAEAEHTAFYPKGKSLLLLYFLKHFVAVVVWNSTWLDCIALNIYVTYDYLKNNKLQSKIIRLVELFSDNTKYFISSFVSADDTAMAVGRVRAAPPSILLTCLCFLFLSLWNHDICTAKHENIHCSVSPGLLRQNPQRNGHVPFTPPCCVRHLRHFASVPGRMKKRIFTHSRIPHYSNHSAVFNIELICSHGDIYLHPGRA